MPSHTTDRLPPQVIESVEALTGNSRESLGETARILRETQDGIAALEKLNAVHAETIEAIALLRRALASDDALESCARAFGLVGQPLEAFSALTKWLDGDYTKTFSKPQVGDSAPSVGPTGMGGNFSLFKGLGLLEVVGKIPSPAHPSDGRRSRTSYRMTELGKQVAEILFREV